MIQNLEIENFKSWKFTGQIKLSSITGFFGPNSSGKTSLIQLLLLLKQTVESTDRQLVFEFGNEKSFVELGTFDDIINDHSDKSFLSVDIRWKLPNPLEIINPDSIQGDILFKDDKMRFKAKVKKMENKNKIIVESFFYILDNYKFVLSEKKKGYALKAENIEDDNRQFIFKNSRGRPWDLPEPIKCYGFPDQIKAYFQNASFLSDLVLEFENLFSNIYYLGPLREYPKRRYTWAGSQPSDMGIKGEKVIDAILSSRERGEKISPGYKKRKLSVEEYVAKWLSDLGLIHSFRVEQITPDSNLYSVKVKKTPDSSEVYITDVGFGVSQILPVIALCYYVPDHSIIIIEQPEIHLHPRVQSELADVFIDAIKVKKIQIILESHSEYLLKRLQLRIAQEKLDNSSVSLYFCETQNGNSHIAPLDVDSYGVVRNWPEDFFGDQLGEMADINHAIIERKLRDSNGA